LCAGGVFWPVLFVAMIAALIASRAMTTATFSCIKKATALGCFPRLKIIHTSRKFMGHIYIPVVNWFLLVFCLGFVATFGSINKIGNAYGTVLSSFFHLFWLCSRSVTLSIKVDANDISMHAGKYHLFDRKYPCLHFLKS